MIVSFYFLYRHVHLHNQTESGAYRMINIAHRINENRIYSEAHIADIHFGAMEPQKQFNILKEQFLDVLAKMKVLDIISINGDIFHHKFMANSDVVMYACYFIEALVNICREKNSTLLIIAGTALHDADQLKLFYHYIGKGVDVRIIEDMRFEYVKGKRVLIIPELYNKGANYYNSFLRGKGLYDACYMHGTFKGTIYGKDIADLNSDREPVFCIEDFANCLGPIISGHNHTPGCHKEHFYYCGSPYRWQFGEEEDKGFIILLHDLTTHKYIVNFEPITSFRYDTINLDSMINSDPHKIIEYIKSKKDEGIEHIRIQFTKNNEENLAIVKNYFRNNTSVKIDADFKNDPIRKEIEGIQEKNKEFEFIFDKSSTPYEKLAKYINQQEGNVIITSDDLIGLLEEEL